MNWGKLCPNLSFTVENKGNLIGNLTKFDHIFSNFNDLIISREEYVFHWGK